MATKTAIRFFLLSVLFAGIALPPHMYAANALRWKGAKIQIGISSSLFRENSNIVRGSDIDGAIRRSLEAWEMAANVEFVVVNTDKQNASPAGPAGDGISVITNAGSAENVLLFTKDAEQVAATTRVFYNGRGYITEADIVLNPYQQFSTDGTPGTFDFQSAVTHEVGHLLGLEHSSVLGATMHESYAKNGVYGLQNFAPRTLAASDIAAVRAIYGPRDDAQCCGQATGKLTLPNGRPAKTADVWLENSDGAVITKSSTAGDGSFHFAGLDYGTYKLFTQTDASTNGFPAQQLGEVAIDGNEPAPFVKRIIPGQRQIELTYIGFNGQLSDVAVSLNAGRTYTIYLGGKKLDPKTISISFNSPYFSVVPNTIRSQEYDQISVVSVDVRIAPRTPKGDYSIAVSSAGDRSYIAGGLSVESFANTLSSTQFFDE